MIINNQNLPYNLRISQNEPLLEMKSIDAPMPGVPGEVFNLAKLTKDDAQQLALWLAAWSGCSIGSADAVAEHDVPPVNPAVDFVVADLESRGFTILEIDGNVIVALKPTGETIVGEVAKPEPNPEEISSSPAKDEELI